MFYVDVVGLT